jgi:hypothetical protein
MSFTICGWKKEEDGWRFGSSAPQRSYGEVLDVAERALTLLQEMPTTGDLTWSLVDMEAWADRQMTLLAECQPYQVEPDTEPFPIDGGEPVAMDIVRSAHKNMDEMLGIDRSLKEQVRQAMWDKESRQHGASIDSMCDSLQPIFDAIERLEKQAEGNADIISGQLRALDQSADNKISGLRSAFTERCGKLEAQIEGLSSEIVSTNSDVDRIIKAARDIG